MASFPSSQCLARSSILKAMTRHAHVPSPCTSVCTMSAQTGLCTGCFRTIAEIAGWGQMTDSEKNVVWSRITERKNNVGTRLGGKQTEGKQPPQPSPRHD